MTTFLQASTHRLRENRLRRRVVVTGAGGWLGEKVSQSLLAAPTLDVVGLKRPDVDLAVPGAFSALLGDGTATTVVHLAASLDRSGSPAADARQWRDTFLVGREVVQAAAARGVDHLVVAGSMDELGIVTGVLGCDEPSRPETMYGLCKSLVREIAAFESRNRQVRVDWFRPTIVYGPGQRGSMLVPAVCDAAQRGEELAVTDGGQLRDFLYVDDLVAWICLAIEDHRRPSPGARQNNFVLHHLGSGRATAVSAVIDRIEAAFPQARLIRGARQRGRHEPQVQVAPISGTAIPQWRPAVPWEEGIDRTIAWWRSVGDG